MSNKYDKPFLRYEEMIELLRSRNITIENEDFAVKALSNMSYYTLVNGYKNSVLSIPGTDMFIPGTTFEELYTLRTIDVSIGNLLLKHTLYIEGSLKSKISYLVSRNYGVYTDPRNIKHDKPGDYLFRDHYSNARRNRNGTLKLLTETMSSTPKKGVFQSQSLLHYIKQHNHIPPWILTTSLTFGQIIMWFTILKPADRLEICNCFLSGSSLSDEEKKEYMKKSLDLLHEFRNIIAHGSRTILDHGSVSIPKKQIISLSKGIITEQDYNSNIFARNGLFAVLTIIITLLNDEYLIASFIGELTFILKPFSRINIGGKSINELFNLPNDIIERLNISQANCKI